MGLNTPNGINFLDMQHEFHPEFFSDEELQKRRQLTAFGTNWQHGSLSVLNSLRRAL